MKQLLFLIILLFGVPGLCFTGDHERWAKIVSGEIVKIRTIRADDSIIKPKLISHGYLIVVREPTPDFDNITQRLDTGYTVEVDRVVKFRTVVERNFATAKQRKRDKQKRIVMNEIKTLLNPTVTGADIEPVLSELRDVLVLINAKTDNAGLREVENVSF